MMKDKRDTILSIQSELQLLFFRFILELGIYNQSQMNHK